MIVRRTWRTAWVLTVCAGLCAAAAPAPQERGLGDLSRRLRAGDRTAIDELLARTKPADIELADSAARADRLRAEIERLRAAQGRRWTRTAPPPEPDAAPAAAPRIHSAEPLREANAWLRAGEPERCLAVLPADLGEGDLLRARALEMLGRDPEALAAYQRVAAAAATPVEKLRAAGDVAHLQWRLRRAPQPENRP